MNSQMCLVTLAFVAAITLAAVDAAVSPPQGPPLPVGVAPPLNANGPQLPARPAGVVDPAKGENTDDLNAESTFGIFGLGLGGGWGGYYGGYGGWGGWGGRYGSYYGWPYGGYRSYYRPYSWGWGW